MNLCKSVLSVGFFILIGMNRKTLLGVVLMSGLFAHPLSAREHQSFDRGWLFTLSDSTEMYKPGYSDGHWRRLNLPHDWAIEGDFSPSNPSGASGGALPGASDGIASTSLFHQTRSTTASPSPSMACI